MSFLKLNGSTGAALVALVMLAVSSQAALAETIYLKCGSFNPLVIDLTKQTVNSYPANITPLSIAWDQNNQAGNEHYEIDRAAGTLRMSGFVPGTDTCTKISAPATKF